MQKNLKQGKKSHLLPSTRHKKNIFLKKRLQVSQFFSTFVAQMRVCVLNIKYFSLAREGRTFADNKSKININ